MVPNSSTKHFYNVLKNEGPAGILFWKHPVEDFNNGSVLVVNPGEEALFIRNGNVVSKFTNGRHELTTQNYPILSSLRNVFSGGISSFAATICFVRTANTEEILWGTDSPIQLRDPVLGIATSVQARGAYKVRVLDANKFATGLLGLTHNSAYQEDLMNFFACQFQQYIKSIIAQVLKTSNEEILGQCANLPQLSSAIFPKISPILLKYGISLIAFSISSLDIPEDSPSRQYLEEAFARKKEKAILGNDFSEIKKYDILTKAAQNPGGGAAAGINLGLGMAAANIIANQKTGNSVNSTQTNYFDLLNQAKQMFDQGLISKTEYDNVKSQILQNMKP